MPAEANRKPDSMQIVLIVALKDMGVIKKSLKEISYQNLFFSISSSLKMHMKADFGMR